MEGCYGQHGWAQFNRNRKDILNELDRVIELSGSRPIQVAHGVAVEAYIRKWFSEFLPKKYAVTSGYIIPELYDDNLKQYHYDIIIYNSLEAPVLWTEGNYDNSEQGKFLAIPAKYVVAVYEVKSRLTKKNINDSLSKLKEVNSFKHQLPNNYHSGVIYIDLKESEVNKRSLLEDLHKGIDAHGFTGGMVLRYEGDTSSIGLISLKKIDDASAVSFDAFNRINPTLPIVKKLDDLHMYYTEDDALLVSPAGAGAGLSVTYTGSHWASSKTYGMKYVKNNLLLELDWSRSFFSEFCMRLISLLNGDFDPEKRSSFGAVFDKIENKNAVEQSQILDPSKAFIRLNIKKINPNGLPVIEYNNEGATINCTASLENVGDFAVTVSDDRFKSSITIPAKRKAERTFSFLSKLKKGENIDDLKEKVLNGKFEFPYRIVYYQEERTSNFIQIKKTIRIRDENFEVIS